MKLLLHICCAPCAIVPVRALRSEGMAITGFFYRHNIHPFSECRRRQETLRDYARQIGLEVIWQPGYDLEGFIRSVVYREEERCLICYQRRLQAAAALAREGHYDAYSTTLLYSRYQKHDDLRDIGESIGRTLGVRFHYRDFRPGWPEGVAESRRIGLYRQKYCGCIYSEKERMFRE
jgi:predicted adenine nucleotide alpha hydrolase (AANH) superfamily ATPase